MLSTENSCGFKMLGNQKVKSLVSTSQIMASHAAAQLPVKQPPRRIKLSLVQSEDKIPESNPTCLKPSLVKSTTPASTKTLLTPVRSRVAVTPTRGDKQKLSEKLCVPIRLRKSSKPSRNQDLIPVTKPSDDIAPPQIIQPPAPTAAFGQKRRRSRQERKELKTANSQEQLKIFCHNEYLNTTVRSGTAVPSAASIVRRP